MSIADTLRECHRIVWDARKTLEPYWPTPTTEDALLFAFTELGEAVDAHLRSKPQYARNRDKDLSVLDELADAALMALTAIGERGLKWFGYVPSNPSLTNMGYCIGEALVEYERRGIWHSDLVDLLCHIMAYPGMDLPARLRARLERIKAKRMPHPTVSVHDAYEEILVRHESEAA